MTFRNTLFNILLIILTVSLLSLIVFAAENSLRSVEVSRPDATGTVTVVGQAIPNEGSVIKSIRLVNQLTGQTVEVPINKNNRFVAKIKAKEGQELDITVTSIRSIARPLNNLEPGVRAFSTAVNGGFFAAKSIKSGYNSPAMVEGKYNFVAHSQMGPFAAGIDSGRAIASIKNN